MAVHVGAPHDVTYFDSFGVEHTPKKNCIDKLYKLQTTETSQQILLEHKHKTQ